MATDTSDLDLDDVTATATDAATTNSATETLNALDVLLGALPSDQASALESALQITLSYNTQTAITAITSTTFTTTTRPTSRPHHETTSFHSTASTISTISFTSSSTASSSTQSSTLPAPPVSQSKNAGAVAGIATGSVAGVVLILLALLYIFRLRKRQGVVQSDSQNSLLGPVKSVRSIGKQKLVNSQPPYVYDPIRPARDWSPPPTVENTPQLGANAPWSSRPGTSLDDGRPLIGTPGSEMAELPAISVARAIDTSFLEPTTQNGPRRFSYPLRKTPSPDPGEPSDEVVSPLLPPPPKAPEHVQRYYARQASIDANLDAYPELPQAYRDRTRSPSAGRGTPDVYRPSRAF